MTRDESYLCRIIGRAVRASRRSQKMSQAKFASVVGISNDKYISNLENGKVMPSIRLLMRIAAVTRSELFITLEAL